MLSGISTFPPLEVDYTSFEEALFEAGFSEVEDVEYGSSRHPPLRELEAHETYPDSPGLPHVIVVEASGVPATTETGPLGVPRAELEAAEVAGRER